MQLPSMNLEEAEVHFKYKFFKTFRSLFMCLSLGGFHLPVNFQEPRSKKIGTVKRVLFLIYRFMVILAHVAIVVKTGMFWTQSLQHTTYTARYIATLLMLNVNALIGTFVFVSEQISLAYHLEPLISSLWVYEQVFGFWKDFSKNRRMVRVWAVFIFVTMIMVSSCSVVFHTLINGQSLFDPDANVEVATWTFYLLTFTFVTEKTVCMIPPITCPVLYTYILCVIRAEFESTKHSLRQSLEATDVPGEATFLQYRERHQALCRAVHHFSNMTRVFVLVMIISAMLNIFLLIFIVSQPDTFQDGIDAGLVMGFLLAFLIIFSLTGKWGQLPTAAHSITEAVADANWGSLPQHVLTTMGVFINVCSNQRVGVNVFGLFTMDSTTPVMVSGTILTYSFVVMQFSLDANELVCQCNSTSTVT